MQSALQRAQEGRAQGHGPWPPAPCSHSAGPCLAHPGVFQAQSGAGEGMRRVVTHPGSPGRVRAERRAPRLAGWLFAAAQPCWGGQGGEGALWEVLCDPPVTAAGRAGWRPGNPNTAHHPGSLTLPFCPFDRKSFSGDQWPRMGASGNLPPSPSLKVIRQCPVSPGLASNNCPG